MPSNANVQTSRSRRNTFGPAPATAGDGDGDGDGDSNAVDPDEVLTAEVRRQLRDLALIAQYGASLRHARLGLDIDTSARLHRALRVPLSSVEADA